MHPILLAVACTGIPVLLSLAVLYSSQSPRWENYRVESRGALNDEVAYWVKARSWAHAGFDSGYFAYLDEAKPERIARLGPHPQIVHMAQGLPVRLFGYHHLLPLGFNCFVIFVAWLIFFALVRPSRAGPFLVFSLLHWPLALWLTAGTQTSLQIALGVVAAGFFYRIILPKRRSPLLHAAFIAFIITATFARFTWSLMLLPYLLVLTGGRSLRLQLLAVVTSLGGFVAGAAFFIRYSQPFPAKWPTQVSSLRGFLDRVGPNTMRNLEAVFAGDSPTSSYVVLILALLTAGLAVSRGVSTAQRERSVDPVALVLAFPLVPILVLVFVFYDWQFMRGERLLVPSVGMALLFLAARSYSHPTEKAGLPRYRLALAAVAGITLCGFPGYVAQQAHFWRARFWSDDRIARSEGNRAPPQAAHFLAPTRGSMGQHARNRRRERLVACRPAGDRSQPQHAQLDCNTPRRYRVEPPVITLATSRYVTKGGALLGQLDEKDWVRLGQVGPKLILQRRNRTSPQADSIPD